MGNIFYTRDRAKMTKEKKKQKKKNPRKWATAHTLLLLGFSRHRYPSYYYKKKNYIYTLLSGTLFNPKPGT
jgi:hypothetical protein